VRRGARLRGGRDSVMAKGDIKADGKKFEGEKHMKKACILFLVVFIISVSVASFAKEDAKKDKGESLFKENCSPCHPDGGNVINQQKTLHKKDREANNIRKPADIVSKMRNPGPGMTKFDEKTIPDKDAKAIAEYILKTFD